MKEIYIDRPLEKTEEKKKKLLGFSLGFLVLATESERV